MDINPFLPCPDEINAQILSYLEIGELKKIETVNKRTKLLVDFVIMQKIKEIFSYDGEADFKKAKQFIDRIFVSLTPHFETKLLNKEILVINPAALFNLGGTINIKQSYEGLRRLPASEIIKIFYLTQMQPKDDWNGSLEPYKPKYWSSNMGTYCCTKLALKNYWDSNRELYRFGKRLLANAPGSLNEQKTPKLEKKNYKVIAKAITEGNIDKDITNVDTKFVEILLNKGLSPRLAMPLPLLYLACGEKGNLDIVRLLVNKGADVNQISSDGSFPTPLHSAVGFKNRNIAEFLLQNGASPNVMDENGQTLMHDAANAGNLHFLKFLYKYKADIDVQNPIDNKTPLFLAASNGSGKLVKFLLKKGAQSQHFCR